MRSIFCKMGIALLVFLLTTASAYSQTLYATDGRGCTPSTLYELSPSNGSIIQTIGATGVSGLTGLAENPVTGALYAVSTGGESCTPNLYSLNKTNGQATLIGPLGVTRGKPDMAFRADGTLFCMTGVPDFSNVFLGTVNLSTGAMNLIGDTGVEMWDIGITFDASGTLIMTNGDTVYTVNTTTGLATYLADMSEETNDTNMMTTHPVSGAVYIADSDNEDTTYLYTIVPATGQMTLLGSNGNAEICAIAFGDSQITPSAPIPALQTWGVILLMGLLMAIVLWKMRARQNRNLAS